MRDQILADCARRLFAGETLDSESDFITSTEPPADYGGPCPRTPFDMNRRFLAIARFNADPEAAILEHVPASRSAQALISAIPSLPMVRQTRRVAPLLTISWYVPTHPKRSS